MISQLKSMGSHWMSCFYSSYCECEHQNHSLMDKFALSWHINFNVFTVDAFEFVFVYWCLCYGRICLLNHLDCGNWICNGFNNVQIIATYTQSHAPILITMRMSNEQDIFRMIEWVNSVNINNTFCHGYIIWNRR